MGEVFCKGVYVYLRAVELADVSRVTKWKCDEFVREMALDPDTLVTSENQKDDIERAIRSSEQLYLIVVIRATDHPIGYIRINWIDSFHHIAWLRIALGEERGHDRALDRIHICGRGPVCILRPLSIARLRSYFSRDSIR